MQYSHYLSVGNQIPAKQGLKLYCFDCFFILNSCGKPNSSKTRIETLPILTILKHLHKWETKFQQNKDWNKVERKWQKGCGRWETKFQQNKDWNADSCIWQNTLIQVGNQIPAKQGLKRNNRSPSANSLNSWETKFQQNKDWNNIQVSTCSAIQVWETKFQQNKDWNIRTGRLNALREFRGKPNSSKTRIETLLNTVCSLMNNFVGNQIPAKQGLKQNFIRRQTVIRCRGKPNSSKTRIETENICCFTTPPLKSGKPNSSKTRIETLNSLVIDPKIHCGKPNSSKTRIETTIFVI